MTTIADAFLEDFEEEEMQEVKGGLLNEPEVKVETIDMDEETEEELKKEVLTELMEDPALERILLQTERLLYVDPSVSFVGQVEDNREYGVLTESSSMIHRIEDEIFVVHKHICDIYASRFPELEQTVLHPVQYARVVKRIKNDIDSVSSAVDGILSEHQKLSTSISASATSGKRLPDSDLKKVLEACDIVIGLDIARNKLLDYIKRRMLYIAPNLCALIGADISAQLMTLAGGLGALARIPSCNIQTLGATKRSESDGYSVFQKNSHAGVITKTSIMLECPEEFYKKALRILSAKITLAARVDCHQTNSSDKIGEGYLKTIKEKIEKWQEPPGAQPVKPLPLPPDKRKSKRAGKRYRKMREKYKVTEMQRMKNRVGFNVGEDRGEEGEGFGMIGKSGTGGVLKIVGNNTAKVRKLEKINKMMIDRERKKRQRRLVKGETSGLATSVVMTEVQGMSFVNPENVARDSKGGESGISTYFGSKSFNKIKL